VPIYEYRCGNGHNFEVFQKMADDPVAECEVCGAPVERVFHPVAVHFKGSGFYTTDYGQKKKAAADEAPSGDKAGSGDRAGAGDKAGAADKAGGSEKAGSEKAGAAEKSGSGDAAKKSSGD
jgi:putative FmdB family regulatory protein